MKKRLLTLFLCLPLLIAWTPGGYDSGKLRAKRVRVRTGNFNGSLSSLDNTVQKALDTLDDAVGGGGAPTTATYITQTPDATLSAEQALSALSSGIMRAATTTGVVTSLTDSAGIAANISDETGTGVMVFGTSPTFTTSILFNAVTDTLAGIQNQNLLDKVAAEIITGAWDFGGATSLEGVNSAAPTTNATGEFALDTTITDHQPLWQYFDGAENMTVIAIDTAQLPALDNEIVKYDAATDKFVLEAEAGGASEWTRVGSILQSENHYLHQLH